MKEKTFEELIKDEVVNVTGFSVVVENQVLQLLQQVREATIAECVEILQNPNIPKSRMESLPTDRIKTEKSPPKTY